MHSSLPNQAKSQTHYLLLISIKLSRDLLLPVPWDQRRETTMQRVFRLFEGSPKPTRDQLLQRSS